MAKKPTPAELKIEGEALSKQIADIRKKDLNFAMVLGKDTVAFVTDRKKNCDILWRTAKKDAGGAKGCKGTVSMSGKVMVLDPDDPSSVPGPLVKAARKYFADRNNPIRIMIKGEEEPEDDEDEEAKAEPAAKVKKEEAEPKAAKSAKPEAEEAGDGGQTAPKGTAGEQDDEMEALRKSLLDDYQSLKPDLDLAEQAQSGGVNKKINGISRVFAEQIDKDVKKAHAVMGLLQTTIQQAKEAGKLGDNAASASNAASVLRRKKLAAMEKGVDKLLERLG
ncbi:MAG: hypothetical protein AAF727_01555 [Pseudomonadota bacterium]